MMPLGFKNSPGIFQRVMEIVLEGWIGSKCLVYVNNSLASGRDEKEHGDRVNEILIKLEAYGLKEKKKNSILGY